MGATIRERPDGLEIEQSRLQAGRGRRAPRPPRGHGPGGGRVGASKVGPSIHTAEAMEVTFPTFVDCMSRLGGRLSLEQ